MHGVYGAARLNQELNGAGLTMNIGKCHVTSAISTELFPMLRMMRYHPISDSEGIRILGIPVGGKQYIQDFLSSVVVNVGNFCDAIATLRCSQIGAALLRHCSGECKVVHVLKCLNPRRSGMLPTANRPSSNHCFPEPYRYPFISPNGARTIQGWGLGTQT